MGFRNGLLFVILTGILISCNWDSDKLSDKMEDDVRLIDGLDYEVLIKWGDEISDDHYFGYDNDFIGFLNAKEKKAQMWVNHQYLNPYFVSGFHPDGDIARHREQIKKEMYQVGGSLVDIKRSMGSWEVVKNPANKRITAAQQNDFDGFESVENLKYSFGTVGNGAGAITPWNTVLSCEENYVDFYGDLNYDEQVYTASKLNWETFFSNPTQHYGWITEFDPQSGRGKKHLRMGRFAHGSSTIVELPDNRVVIYSTDHVAGGSLYKYISDSPYGINPGQLYVANIDAGQWTPVSLENEKSSGVFSSELEMLVRCRDAAKLLLGTSFSFPKDVAIAPLTKSVYLSIEGDSRNHGSILQIEEKNQDPSSLEFKVLKSIVGGVDSGFSHPSDLLFDSNGNLYFSTNIPASSLGKEIFEDFGNNGLFVKKNIDQQLIQLASAPIEACFSGLVFGPDQESLFMSVKHPGALSDLKLNTSKWPGEIGDIPKPAVIVISGGVLDDLLEGK